MPTGQSTTTTITVSLPDVDYFLTEYWGHENLTSVDAATGTYFADAEKSTAITSDDNSCWLAAGCNILHWSGWAAAGDNSMTSEDALFSYANRCWGYNDGGYALDAFTWWVSGMSTFPTITAPSGGDKFPEVLYSSDMAATVSFIGLNAVYNLASMLELGLGVSLSIRSTYISHALTCWGYRVEDGRVYLYYSDSDDAIQIIGYEYHSGTQHYAKYSKKLSITGGGTMTISHTSDTGYKFVKYYNSTRLTSYVYFENATLIGQVGLY